MKIFVVGHKSPDLDSVASAAEYTEFLKKLKRYENAEIIASCAEGANEETKYIFKKFGIELPILIDEQEISSNDGFILVDHNEESQRSEKVISSQILEIVDHHKLNINFTVPIRIDIRPLGSTSSIIYELFETYGHKPSKECESLTLAAILSDTVGLKSSTTTGTDVTYAKKLSKTQRIDLEKLTFEIFKAKSDLSALSPDEIVKKDFKVFDFGGKKVFIGQVETVEPDEILKNKEMIIKALEEVKAKENAGHAYLVVTDILKINSQILYTTEEEGMVVEKAFTTTGEGGVANIGPRLSRKKDIAPAIETALQS